METMPNTNDIDSTVDSTFEAALVTDCSSEAVTHGSAGGTASRLGERGANLVEYALLMALIAIVCVAAVSALGASTTMPYSDLQSGILGGG